MLKELEKKLSRLEKRVAETYKETRFAIVKQKARGF
jgi:hypothetical protein